MIDYPSCSPISWRTRSSTDRDTAPSVDVTETPSSVRVSVHDNGPGLPVDQQRLLETRDIDEYDKLDMGFGLNLVRLFTESYSTEIETAVTDEGTTIMLDFPRTKPEVAGAQLWPLASQVFVALSHRSSSYSLPQCSPGWCTGSSLRHWVDPSRPSVSSTELQSRSWGGSPMNSIASSSDLCSSRLFPYCPLRTAITRQRSVWLASAGVLLWIVAAGIIAPIWLQLIGIPASIPNLSIRLLVNHVAWDSPSGS